MTAYADINIDISADFRVEVQVEDVENNRVNISDVLFEAALKRQHTDDVPTKFDVSIIDANAGLFEISLNSIKTKNLVPGATYVWDVFGNYLDGTRERIIEGTAKAVPSVSVLE